MRKTALIIGANSMDAKELTHILLAKGYRVVLTYRRNSFLNEPSPIEALFHTELALYDCELDFAVCDMTDQSSVNALIHSILGKYNSIEELYLLAAMSHVGNSFTQKEYSILCNGQSYYYFLEAVKNYTPTTRVYGAMTSELAGNVPDGYVFDESTPWDPRSPYAIGKALGGHWIRYYRSSKESNLFCCFGILFNHASTYRSKDFFIRKVTSHAAQIKLGKTNSLKLGNLQFSRDEHWSSFGCEMMWKMLQNDKPQDYVIATGETHSGTEYLDLAFSYFDLDWRDYVQLDTSLLRPNEVVRLIGNSTKAQRELGWNPQAISFKDIITALCKFDYELESTGTAKRPQLLDIKDKRYKPIRLSL